MMMKKQSGAALIVVLSLLTISLMVGLSSIQSSQIDERLAGNYRAKSQAQMGAEQAASLGLELLRADSEWLSVSELDDLDWGYANKGEAGDCSLPVVCYYRYVEDAEGLKYIFAMGRVEGGESEPIFVNILVEEPPPLSFNFRDFSPLSILGDIDEFDFRGMWKTTST